MRDAPPSVPAFPWRDLLIVAVVAVAATTWQIDRKPIWLDEAVSWDMALRAPGDLAAKTAADIHPPLYYLTLSAWIRAFGDSLTALRGLSALATLLSALILYRLARRWLTPAAALAAVLAYVLSPHTMYFAQEARMYAMGACFVLGAVLAYRRWVESAFSRTPDLIVLALTAAAAMYTHYATALPLVALSAHLILVRRPGTRAVTRWLGANVAAAVLYIPWMPTALSQIVRGQSWRQSVELADLPHHAVEAIFQLEFGLYQFPHFGMWPYAFVAALALAGVYGIVRAIRAEARPSREADWLLVLLVVAPLLLALFAQLRSGYLSLPRYLAYLLPFIVLLLARGMTAAFAPRTATAAIAALALLQLPALRHYYAQPTRDYDPAPVITFLQARIAQTTGTPRDRIVFAPGYMHLMFRYYWRDMTSEGVSSPAEMDRLISSSAGARLWVIEDYRWVHGHGGVERGDLEPVTVAGLDEKRVRVFHLRHK